MLPDDMLKVRVKISGPEAWQCRVEDAETGKLLPFMVEGLSIAIKDGAWTLSGSLVVCEVEAEVHADATEVVERFRLMDGALVRVTSPDPSPASETADAAMEGII